MTYNVFGGTLNLALSIYLSSSKRDVKTMRNLPVTESSKQCKNNFTAVLQHYNTLPNSNTSPRAMCFCWRSVVCYCRPSTLEKSTCLRPVCLVTHNISSEAENSFISAVLP